MPWYAGDAGGRLWYEERGAGTPVVFIHGWCMSSAVWRLQREGLSHAFRVIAVDLPGHGTSPPPAGGFHVKCCAAGVAGLCESLDLHEVLLVGWSLGSLIALEVSLLLRERLSGLVLTAGTPRFMQGDGFPYGLSSVEVEGMARKVQRSLRRALDGFSARMFAPGELDDPALAVMVQELLSALPVPAVDAAIQALDALVETDQRERLALIDLPTLILNGDSDVICLPQASAFLAERIPTARQVVFAGCGHAPFLTQSRRFNACLEEFGGMVSGCAH
jgi:pimeloyl-[acyl-carrier protein] methyl ester esterase